MPVGKDQIDEEGGANEGLNPFLHRCPCQDDGVEESAAQGNLIVYSRKQKMAYALNESSRAIWEMCEGDKTVLEITRELGLSFSSPVEAILPDIVKAIERFQELNLIRKWEDIVYQYPSRVADVEENTVIDKLVLYFPDPKMAFTLNHTSKAIWDLCDGKRTLLNISQKLARVFSCPSKKLLPDIINTIKEFQDFQLIDMRQ